jgi:hypothetical protein
MAAGTYIDDNNHPIGTPTALPGNYSTNGIKVASTGAGTAEVDVTSLHTLAKTSVGSRLMVRVTCLGTNPALYAFGAAGASASHTGNTNMRIIPANAVDYVAVRSTEVAFYHQQITGASTIQVEALG